MRVAIHTQIQQAMRVLIHTHISCRLPPLNTGFHSVATRSANALKGYAKAPSPLRYHGTNRSTLTPDGYCETQ